MSALLKKQENIAKTLNQPTNSFGNSNSVGLSYSPYLKNGARKHKNAGSLHSWQISVNPNYLVVPDAEDLPQFEYAIGSSWARIANDRIDPFTTETPRQISKRGTIKKFTRKSRQRFMVKTSKINQDTVDPKSVVFGTVTAPSPAFADGAGWREVDWSSRLNNLLTQFRQKFKGTAFCGFWRRELQDRGAPHWHLVLINIPYVDHGWLATTWNNIAAAGLSFREKQKHLMSGTSIELARDWNAINDYCSKTMAYVQKDETWKYYQNFGEQYLPDGRPNPQYDPEFIAWTEGLGRHWGVINKSNLDAICEVVVDKFDNQEQYHKVKRVMDKYVSSAIKRKLESKHKSKRNYNKKVGKKLDKIFKSKRYGKKQAFIPEGEFLRILEWAGVDISNLVSAKFSSNKPLKEPDRFINVHQPIQRVKAA